MSEQVKLPTRKYAWFVLVMMVLLYLVNYADRFVAVGLLEEIKKTFEISDTYMGFLIGPAFAIIYTLFAIPIARLADRHNRVRIIAIGAIVWSAFTVMSGLAKTPEVFALARIGVGVGEAAFLAPAFSILSDYFPPKKRALAFAVLNFGVYFGQIVGLKGGASIAVQYDWHTAFILLGVPGILLALVTWVFVKEPERGRLDPQSTATLDNRVTPFGETLKILWQKRSYRLMTLGTALGGFASYAFGYWAIAFFARLFDLTTDEANTRYGFTAFLAGLSGAIIIGFICDRLASRDTCWPYRLSAIGLMGFCISMLIMCFTTNVNFATFLVLPAGLLAGGWVIALQSALQDLLPADQRATGTSIWAFALTFTGLVVGVWSVGALNDYFAAEFGAKAIRYSMALALTTAIPAAILIFTAGRTVDADRQALIKEFS